jgi:hypothetical protein
MEIHVFSGKDWAFGFTKDRSGSNLPADYRPWVFHKSLELNSGDEPRSLVSSEECLNDIHKYGFHITASRVRITEECLK